MWCFRGQMYSGSVRLNRLSASAAPLPLPRRRLVVVTLCLMLCQLLNSMDSSIISTAMPRIAAELAGLEYYAWIGTAYAVGTVTTIPLTGKLGDIFGRKPFVI